MARTKPLPKKRRGNSVYFRLECGHIRTSRNRNLQLGDSLFCLLCDDYNKTTANADRFVDE